MNREFDTNKILLDFEKGEGLIPTIIQDYFIMVNLQ